MEFKFTRKTLFEGVSGYLSFKQITTFKLKESRNRIRIRQEIHAFYWMTAFFSTHKNASFLHA